MSNTPIYREDDHEHLGYVLRDDVGWQAQTIFGYTITRTETEKEAEQVVRERGLAFLTGMWQYFDKDDKDWFPCVIKEANPTRVIVIRTNVLGYQDPDEYKIVTLMKPTDEVLMKMS